MAVCAAYGIAHSEFLSWDSGDRDKAIWWHLRQKQACPGCGTRAEEWDPALGGHRQAYSAHAEVCRGCQQIESRKSAMTGDEPRGTQIVLTRHHPDDPPGQEEPHADAPPPV